MARWTEPRDPMAASKEFGYTPGNYVIWYDDSTAYVGRQSATTNRIRAAINKHPRQVIGVQFMQDRDDNDCLRVDRERRKIRALLSDGVILRNKIDGAVPSSCEVDW